MAVAVTGANLGGLAALAAWSMMSEPEEMSPYGAVICLGFALLAILNRPAMTDRVNALLLAFLVLACVEALPRGSVAALLAAQWWGAMRRLLPPPAPVTPL